MGAGSAGAVVAARLSEDPAVSVLVVEAGPDYESGHTPAAIAGPNFFAALAEPGHTWPDLTGRLTAQQAETPIARGRGLGGSSAVNAQGIIRGVPDDYDGWAQRHGCEGWTWADVLPVFIAAEDDRDFGHEPLHGIGGPTPLARRPRTAWGAIDDALTTAALEAGYPWCPDYHQPDALGVSPGALMRDRDRRVSTNDAYLQPARGRDNLTVLGDSLVHRVALDKRRAVGVVTDRGEIPAREVIVSAGAIHSPALLLRSAIGPEIGRHGVGTNLMEHPVAGPIVVLADPIPSPSEAFPLNCLVRYTSGLAAAGEADMQMLPLNLLGVTDPLNGLGCIWSAVMRVFSRGTVTLRSADASVDPVVEFNLLADDRDMQRMIDGVRRVVDLTDHEAFTAIANAVVMDAEGTQPHDLADEAHLAEWLRANVAGYAHAAGTCRMGRSDDPMSTVDAECNVIGIAGLRVVDASVMPEIPRANTNMTTIMIAERAAQLIRDRRTT